MKIYSIEKTLTDDKINYYNKLAENQQVTIVFENTKGLSKNAIKKLNDNIVISITGGLDPRKSKFNNEYYQERTYYSNKELALIIDKFEKMERNINPLWSDLEKTMYVYKNLCESLTYSESTFNGRDASRNLLGMITNQSVCSGFSIEFKEAMDRLGIDCVYQNRQSHHSWNLVYIDGAYRAMELTWDAYQKENNTCGFGHFAREDEEEFYSNEHHDISMEEDEIQYHAQKIPVEKVKEAYRRIASKKIFKTKFENSSKLRINEKNNIIVRNNNLYFDDDSMKENTYIRKDGSSFLLYPTGKQGKGVTEYYYLTYSGEKKELTATKIYSEMNLVTSNKDLRNNIANNLLGKERIEKKIKNFNGYVGYVRQNDRNRYYNKEFEERELNIYR